MKKIGGLSKRMKWWYVTVSLLRVPGVHRPRLRWRVYERRARDDDKSAEQTTGIDKETSFSGVSVVDGGSC